MKLLTLHNQKLLKSQDYNYISVGLHLLPYNLADSNHNLCTHSTKSCRESCLNFSGKGGLTKVQESRKKKTLYYLYDRISFLNHLSAEIYYYKTVAQFSNKNLSVRLNLTSDVDWQQEYINGQTLFEIHSDVTFYDYTKHLNRLSFYDNYHLIYSYDKSNHLKGINVLDRGDRLAVVFKEIPDTFCGYPVINGDDNDLIFTKPKGVILGLVYKKVIKLGYNNAERLKTSTLVVH